MSILPANVSKNDSSRIPKSNEQIHPLQPFECASICTCRNHEQGTRKTAGNTQRRGRQETMDMLQATMSCMVTEWMRIRTMTDLRR